MLVTFVGWPDEIILNHREGVVHYGILTDNLNVHCLCGCDTEFKDLKYSLVERMPYSDVESLLKNKLITRRK